ncbi:RusA family crossover junction endodeoxyribonuclease [Solibacillus sp. MA9]|uniref:RusA family crossover junction endodeoxyribonuclease n=1 Tax=Solibacillus palustris TaxID=2908203 RepID=A0ABS9UC80_9BACL|nr:RusA family crossover junction endodeoxyribonuclease [Solibacillus sp. MA9]MCH7321759.1 RusA family crossover junction endodeoxyribonuclease [Solibacillus sp. MA9]
MIQFTIPGATQAQERPRFSRAGNGVRTHDAPKSRAYKDLVKVVAWDNKPQEPLQGPLKLEVDVYLVPPKADQTKPKLARMACGEMRPIKKPDLDNLVKGIKDGCSKIIWVDDAQIVELVVRKFYAMQPRAEVKVEAV